MRVMQFDYCFIASSTNHIKTPPNLKEASQKSLQKNKQNHNFQIDRCERTGIRKKKDQISPRQQTMKWPDQTSKQKKKDYQFKKSAEKINKHIIAKLAADVMCLICWRTGTKKKS